MIIQSYYPLKGFKNYEITELGYVRRIGKIGHVKRYVVSKQLFVDIYDDKTNKVTCNVAELVAKTFLDFNSEYQYLEFNDRNSHNCKLDNLTVIDILEEDNDWKIITISPKYEVSKEGEIRNRITGKLKSQYITLAGYKATHFSYKGKLKLFLVHRLVAEAFIPNLENKPHVNHKDLNKVNNSLSNLEWVTAKENINHKVAGS